MLHAILAAVLGTVAMTLSSTTEMQWRGRAASAVPGVAANKVLHLVGVPTLEGRALDILATWAHWLYGAAWGVLFWALQGPLGVTGAGIVFFLVVWLVEQIELPLLGIGVPWPWKWGARENLIDAWHHFVYAGGTVLAYQLLAKL